MPLWLTLQSDLRAHKLSSAWVKLNWNGCFSTVPGVLQLLMHLQSVPGAHLKQPLGKECWVLAPRHPLFHYRAALVGPSHLSMYTRYLGKIEQTQCFNFPLAKGRGGRGAGTGIPWYLQMVLFRIFMEISLTEGFFGDKPF